MVQFLILFMKIKTTQRKVQAIRTGIIIVAIVGVLGALAGAFWAFASSGSCKATYIRQADKSSSGVQDCTE